MRRNEHREVYSSHETLWDTWNMLERNRREEGEGKEKEMVIAEIKFKKITGRGKKNK